MNDSGDRSGGSVIRRAVACIVLALWPAVSHAADPLTLLLLSILRQQITSAIEEAIEQSQRERERAAALAPPPSPFDIDDQKLRALIDEGFVYLSASQRAEVFASVKRVLDDPRNAAMRPTLVQELAIKASAARQAVEELRSLSDAQKRTLAVQAREEYEKLAPEERQKMLQVLQAGVAPLPRDLNEMILAEFRNVSAPTPAAPAQ
jgi:hypothetical protein